MIELVDGRLDSFQRILAMTVMTMPIWIVFAIIALFTVGAPSFNQVFQSFIVGVNSGVIATTLFFMATDRVRYDQEKLAAVETTQSPQLIFVIIGEMLILSIAALTSMAILGIIIIIIGMSLHSFHAVLRQQKFKVIKNEE